MKASLSTAVATLLAVAAAQDTSSTFTAPRPMLPTFPPNPSGLRTIQTFPNPPIAGNGNYSATPPGGGNLTIQTTANPSSGVTILTGSNTSPMVTVVQTTTQSSSNAADTGSMTTAAASPSPTTQGGSAGSFIKPSVALALLTGVGAGAIMFL